MEKKPSKLEMEVRESEIGRGFGESMFRICSIEGRERKICLARSQGLLSLRHSLWVFRFDHSTTYRLYKAGLGFYRANKKIFEGLFYF